MDLFRANSLFRNFEIKGPADRVLIYLILFIGDCLTKIAQCTSRIVVEAGGRVRGLEPESELFGLVGMHESTEELSSGLGMPTKPQLTGSALRQPKRPDGPLRKRPRAFKRTLWRTSPCQESLDSL